MSQRNITPFSLTGQRKDMRIMKDIFLKKMNFPAPAQLSSFPLLDRLLVFNLKVWVFTRGKRFLWMSDIYIVQLCIWRAVLVVSMGFSMFRWNGQEYSQRPVYRGPASSVLYFSEQPTYSCWMVSLELYIRNNVDARLALILYTQ